MGRLRMDALRNGSKTILPTYLTETQVAEITGFSLSKLRKARKRLEGIPFSKAGKNVRYLLKDVTDYMKGHRVKFSY